MKTKRISPILAVACLTALGTLSVNAQTTKDIAPDPTPEVVERGFHHTVYQTVRIVTDQNGDLATQTNFYTTLATGMAYRDPNTGQWQDSVAAFEIFPDGVIARQTQHQVMLAPNPNTAGAVDLVMPDGQRMVSHVVGLSYYDAASGKSVLIAPIKDAQGALLLGNDQVVYPDAFANLSADLHYRITLSGLEQEIILREQPPGADAFGLDPASSRLEMLTEFEQAPNPTIEMRLLKEEPDIQVRQAMVEPDLVDDFLDFGPMQMSLGKAFQLTDQPEDPAMPIAPVAKHWENADGRLLLFESVELRDIAGFLKDLPPNKQANLHKPDQSKVMASRREILPARAEKRASTNPVLVAQAPLKGKGLVLDYNILTSQSNFTFQGTTTYFVTNSVTLSGTTTIEGSAVVKFSTNSTPDITINGPINCLTKPYYPAIFTGKDDDSAGDKISGSTGSPVWNGYGHVALIISSSTSSLSNLRISYVRGGINYLSAGPHTVSHVQIQYGHSAFYCYVNADLSVRNALVHDQYNAAFFMDSGIARAEHMTIVNVPWLKVETAGPCSLYVTNCIIANATNVMGSYSGSNFTNLPSASGLFQTVGAGNFYLANGSPYRNAGTTSINTQLLADLKKLTTYPPLVLNSQVTVPTTWSPVVQRDIDTPDLGYHYPSLDLAVNGIQIQNTTLTLTNGVAVCVYGWAGLWLMPGSKIVSTGSPAARNVLARFANVQEQPNDWGSAGAGSYTFLIIPVNSDTTSRTADFSFTDFYTLNTYTNQAGAWYSTSDDIYNVTRFNSLHCEYYSGRTVIGGTNNSTMLVQNNLFERATILYYNYPAFSIYNNHHHGGLVQFVRQGSNLWTVKDDVFDNCTLLDTYGGLTNGYNGYLGSVTRLTPNQSTDVVLSSFTYTNGAFGRYYQVSTNFSNAGSRGAGAAGLYHFTTTANQTKETNSTVDIGYHFIAVDGNGNPIDTDGDGLPDYYEDKNGNGAVDSGETNSNSATDFGLKVWITQPKNNSIIP